MNTLEKILTAMAAYWAALMINLLVYAVMGQITATVFFSISLLGAIGWLCLRIGKRNKQSA